MTNNIYFLIFSLAVLIILFVLLHSQADAKQLMGTPVKTHKADCVLRQKKYEIIHICKLRPVSGYSRALFDASE